MRKSKKNLTLFPLKNTVTLSTWITFFISSVLLTLLIIWVFLGTITVSVYGRGIVVTERGFSSVLAPNNITVGEVFIQAGDKVIKGTPLVDNLSSLEEAQILEVFVKPGDFVKKDAPLVWMELLSSSKKNKVLIFGYFPLDSGKKLHINTPISMTIPYINSNIYGSLKGKIVAISSYAVSKETLLSEIQNETIVNNLVYKNSAVIKAIIEPLYENENYVWTSGLSPQIEVTTGTVGIIQASVEKIAPIYYLIPLSRFKNYQVVDEN